MIIRFNSIYKLRAIAIIGTLAIFSSCKDEVTLPDQPLENYIQVYMPQAVNGPVVSTLKISDAEQDIIFGANYGGEGYPSEDIPVKFSVKPELAESYNLANGTNYELLPSASYTMGSTEAIIAKGKLNTDPLKIKVKTTGDGAMDILKDYILPVSMEAPMKVNEALRTTYFIVRAQPQLSDYPDFDRSQWQIAGFSSQEANGEGPDNGRAIFVLDNNPSTFWHSQWQGGTPGPPHYLIVDMGETKTMHGIVMQARQGDNAGKPNAVSVEISNDNANWQPAGSFNLLNNTSVQKQFLPAAFNEEARYFKVTINSSYNASYTHLAELGAF